MENKNKVKGNKGFLRHILIKVPFALFFFVSFYVFMEVIDKKAIDKKTEVKIYLNEIEKNNDKENSIIIKGSLNTNTSEIKEIGILYSTKKEINFQSSKNIKVENFIVNNVFNLTNIELKSNVRYFFRAYAIHDNDTVLSPIKSYLIDNHGKQIAEAKKQNLEEEKKEIKPKINNQIKNTNNFKEKPNKTVKKSIQKKLKDKKINIYKNESSLEDTSNVIVINYYVTDVDSGSKLKKSKLIKSLPFDSTIAFFDAISINQNESYVVKVLTVIGKDTIFNNNIKFNKESLTEKQFLVHYFDSIMMVYISDKIVVLNKIIDSTLIYGLNIKTRSIYFDNKGTYLKGMLLENNYLKTTIPIKPDKDYYIQLLSENKYNKEQKYIGKPIHIKTPNNKIYGKNNNNLSDVNKDTSIIIEENSNGLVTTKNQVDTLKEKPNSLVTTKNQVDTLKEKPNGLVTTKNQVDTLKEKPNSLVTTKNQVDTLKEKPNSLVTTKNQVNTLKEKPNSLVTTNNEVDSLKKIGFKEVEVAALDQNQNTAYTYTDVILNGYKIDKYGFVLQSVDTLNKESKEGNMIYVTDTISPILKVFGKLSPNRDYLMRPFLILSISKDTIYGEMKMFKTPIELKANELIFNTTSIKDKDITETSVSVSSGMILKNIKYKELEYGHLLADKYPISLENAKDIKKHGPYFESRVNDSFENLLPDKQYFIKPYAILKENNKMSYVYGSEVRFRTKKASSLDKFD